MRHALALRRVAARRTAAALPLRSVVATAPAAVARPVLATAAAQCARRGLHAQPQRPQQRDDERSQWQWQWQGRGAGAGAGATSSSRSRVVFVAAGVASAAALLQALSTQSVAQADSKAAGAAAGGAAAKPAVSGTGEQQLLPAVGFELPPTSNIHRFALTGGPCGGKSTALVEVADRLRSLGYQVFVVPEQATIFHIAGVHFPAGKSDAETITWEASRVLSQIAMEDAFARVAVSSGKPTIILCDRGTMDTKAYMADDKWQLMLDEMKWNAVALRDRRYDAVVHMVSAAIGAEKFYTTANNEARRETLQEASEVDAKTRDAWIGHRQFRIIDNSTDFKTKIQRVSEFFCSYLNQPVPHGVRRYFLVKYLPDRGASSDGGASHRGPHSAAPVATDHITPDMLPVRLQEAQLTSTFLKKKEDGCDIVLRRRGQDGHYTYSMAFKDHTSGQNIIRTRTLSSKQYLSLLDHADSTLVPVHRRRLCFQWGGQYYELEQPFAKADTAKAADDAANANAKGPNVLIVESDQTGLTFPPFFQIEREVTGDYNLLYLAQKLPSPMPGTTATAAAAPAAAAAAAAAAAPAAVAAAPAASTAAVGAAAKAKPKAAAK